jgi:hypothetical protein
VSSRAEGCLPDRGDKTHEINHLAGNCVSGSGGIGARYQGFTYTRREKVIDIGPIHATADTQEHVPLPPIVGGLALAAGAVLLVMGAKQKE